MLRHEFNEDPARRLRSFLEADETFVGGRGDPTRPGRSTANVDKTLIVAAVEKMPAPKNKNGKHGHAVKRQHEFFAGAARISVLPAAMGAELGAFLKANSLPPRRQRSQVAPLDRRVRGLSGREPPPASASGTRP